MLGFCERRAAGVIVQIYEFKFIAVVFEKDYSLLKQAVGEELGGVRDNEFGGLVPLDPAALNSNLFMEIYYRLSL